MKLLTSVLMAAALLAPSAAWPQRDSETLRNAKTLFFDRQYAEAREAWQEVRSSARGRDARAALYWIARCSEKLGESDRALKEYGTYLDSHPSDRTLREEANTSRVALAAKLYRSGTRKHLGILQRALHHENRTVRYFAALQMASLGPEVGAAAVPVLQEILRDETDPDLVERAKLALLRLDRSALAEAIPPSPRHGAQSAGWIRVRVWEKGNQKPKLSLNLPVFLAEMVFDSLPDEARDELRQEGFDASSFWQRLMRSGPADILSVEGEDGERIEVWIE